MSNGYWYVDLWLASHAAALLPPGDTEDSGLSLTACLPDAQANGQLPHAPEPDAKLQVGWPRCATL